MRILILTSCTGKKAIQHEKALVQADFAAGSTHVRQREHECGTARLPAAQLYTGQQHLRLMRGVQRFRESPALAQASLELWILSAGYGLVPSEQHLAPYECTFQGMPKPERRRWADHLEIPARFRQLLGPPYTLALVLLGDQYLEACALDHTVVLGGPTFVFCSTGTAAHLPTRDHLRPIVLGTQETKRFACGLVGLKGEIVGRLLTKLGTDLRQMQHILDPAFDLLPWLSQ